ncbi:MAG TPA: S1/P1 nuclease [Pirellulales bacterium]|jgi:hypothetical protein|nr:S1/P1 nuclease [Pirellulales bacterium]
MKRAGSLGLALLVALLAATVAYAWNFSGHMTTGAIAYNVLSQSDPQALAAAIALLKQHPHYEIRWARQLEKVDPADRDQALFMLACRWPDDIRGNPDYNHPEWHYIDYAYKPPGQPDSVQTAEVKDPNIETAFRSNVDILKGDVPAPEKAVALCWVMHLIGDCHMPLHATSLYSTEYPDGDQGGNKQFIRAKPDGRPVKLHFFWDGLVSGSEDTRDIRKLAIELQDQHPKAELDPKEEDVSTADFANWIQDSLALAKSKVYLDGRLASSPDRNSAPVLPDDYIQQAKKLADVRVTLAGYRMADVVAKLFHDHSAP